MPAYLSPEPSRLLFRPARVSGMNLSSPQTKGLIRFWPLNAVPRSLTPGSPASGYTPSGAANYKGTTIGGLAFDAVSGGIDSGEQYESLTSGAGSLLWWQFPRGAYNSGVHETLWGENGFGATEFSAQHFTDNNLYVGFNGGGATRIVVAASATNWLQGQWSPYVFTWNGTTTFLYHRGLQIGTSSSGTNSPAKTLWFGMLENSGSHFNGLLAHIALWNRALTPSEVWALYAPATRWDLYEASSRRVWRVWPTHSAWTSTTNVYLQPGSVA